MSLEDIMRRILPVIDEIHVPYVNGTGDPNDIGRPRRSDDDDPRTDNRGSPTIHGGVGGDQKKGFFLDRFWLYGYLDMARAMAGKGHDGKTR